MSSEERDPLLEKLHALPAVKLDAAKSARALEAAEAALPGNVRPGTRWPEFALAMTLALTGALYTVGTVNKLNEIYVSGSVAAAGTR